MADALAGDEEVDALGEALSEVGADSTDESEFAVEELTEEELTEEELTEEELTEEECEEELTEELTEELFEVEDINSARLKKIWTWSPSRMRTWVRKI